MPSKKRRVFRKKRERGHPPPDDGWHLVAAALLEPRTSLSSLNQQLAFLKRVDNKAKWNVRRGAGGLQIVYNNNKNNKTVVAHIRPTTNGRGYGVFAAADIPAGAVIVPYFGDAQAIAVVDRMPWEDRSRVENYSVPHPTDATKIITGYPTDENGELNLSGNSAKHFGALINDPHPLPARANVNYTNFDTLSDKSRVPTKAVPHPLCVATKRIREGDELLLDYQWSDGDWARIKQGRPVLPTEQHVMAFTMFEMLGIKATGAHKRAFAVSAAWTRAPTSYPERLKIADQLLVAMGAELRSQDAARLRDGWPVMDEAEALNARIDEVIAPGALATPTPPAPNDGGGGGGGGTEAQRKVASRLREVSTKVDAAGSADSNPELAFETNKKKNKKTKTKARVRTESRAPTAAAAAPPDLAPDLAFKV